MEQADTQGYDNKRVLSRKQRQFLTVVSKSQQHEPSKNNPTL